jgi:hypothetical protein
MFERHNESVYGWDYYLLNFHSSAKVNANTGFHKIRPQLRQRLRESMTIANNASSLIKHTVLNFLQVGAAYKSAIQKQASIIR